MGEPFYISPAEMSNVYNFRVDRKVAAEHVRDVANCLLHTLFFHRYLFRHSVAVEATIESIGFPYVKIKNQDEGTQKLHTDIRDALEALPHRKANRRVEILVEFVKTTGIIWKSKEPWEQWRIVLEVLSYGTQSPDELAEVLGSAQMEIVTQAQSNSEVQFVQAATAEGYGHVIHVNTA